MRPTVALPCTLLMLAATGAPAAGTTYNVSGELASSVNTCNNVVVTFTGNDCSYARTRSPPNPVWQGPYFAGAYYARGSAGDDVGYAPVAGDGRLAPTLSGTVTIDDGGTPADGSDDTISAHWVLGAAAFNVQSNVSDRVVERWDAWVHDMPATPVDAAVAQPGGGFAYRIGTRGTPTPAPLSALGNPADVFPSATVPGDTGATNFWDATAAATPASARTGIERSPGFGAFGAGQPLTPNVGGATTAAFTNYSCTDLAGDTDCTAAEVLAGSRGPDYRNEDGTTRTPTVADPAKGDCVDGIDNDGNGDADLADPQCTGTTGPPGFDNVVLLLTTDGAGAITSALAFWTREYVVAFGADIAGDPPGSYLTDNSWVGGTLSFTGATGGSDPIAQDDGVPVPIAVQEGTSTPVAVLANDTLGEPAPNTLAVVTPPANGTAEVTGDTITYTPTGFYSGPDGFVYRVTDGDGGTDTATVTLTVTGKAPSAGDFTATSVDGEVTDPVNVLAPPTVLGSGTSASHVVRVTGVAAGGSCTASGPRVTFAPAQSFNGTASCEFEIEDADGDTDTGVLTVDVSGNPTIVAGGLPGGGSALGPGALLALLSAARRRRVRPSAGSA